MSEWAHFWTSWLNLPPQYNCVEKCRESWKNWRPGISYSNQIPALIPVCEIANSGMGRKLKKSIPTIREREGNEKKAFPKFGNGKGMKKSIPIIRERESEAFILGNGREQEFPLTPAIRATWSSFFWSRNSRFESQFRTKNTIFSIWYTVYMQPKKQLKVQFIGIFEEIDSFYWPKMHF